MVTFFFFFFWKDESYILYLLAGNLGVQLSFKGIIGI